MLTSVKADGCERAMIAFMTQATLQRPTIKHPFALPARLPPSLERVRAYWRGLLRGGAHMPFWDDARLTDLPDLGDRLFLIDVFAHPERFRFAVVGKAVGGAGLGGVFLDDADLGRPFEFLRAQCTATVECAGPTLHRYAEGYSRLILPMWGDGRISMLLGAVE